MAWLAALLGLLIAACGATAAEERAVTATEAIQLATESDSGLRLSKLNLTITELRLEAARNALYLPDLSLSISPPQWTSNGLGNEVTASIGTSLPLPWGQGNLSANIGLNYDVAASSFAAPTWQVSLSDLLRGVNPGGSLTSLESSEQAVAAATRSLARAQRQLVVSTLQAYQGLLSEATQAEQDEQSVTRLKGELAKVEELAADGYKGDQDVNEAKLLLLDAQVRAEKSAAAHASDLEAFCRETLGLSENCAMEPLGLSMADLLEAAHKLLLADVPEGAVEAAESVINARQAVEDAETSLKEAKGSFLPSLTLSGKIDASEWRIGVGFSFDLFSASRSADVRIAEANVSLVKQKLDSALRSARNQILDLKASLLTAVRSGESLGLEDEKWALQEKLMTVRRDAGTLSDSEWADFLEEKDSYAVDAAGRAASLLVAHLSYRDALGMELDWEGWLQ